MDLVIINNLFICLQARLAFTFLLDEKSKQKNQAKIIISLYAQCLLARSNFGWLPLKKNNLFISLITIL